MHSWIVAGLFALMVLAPCFFAQCYGHFPFRLKLRWVRPAVPIKRMDTRPLVGRQANPGRDEIPATGIKLAPARRVPEPNFSTAVFARAAGEAGIFECWDCKQLGCAGDCTERSSASIQAKV